MIKTSTAGAAAAAIVIGLASGAAQAEEFVVSAAKSVTGTYAFVGAPQVDSIKLAVDQINETKFLGEGNTIKLIINDDASDRGQHFALLNRAAIQEKALMFLGTANSSIGIAIAPVVNNEHSIPYFATASTTVPFQAGPWWFKVSGDAKASVMPVAEYAAEKGNLKRPIIIYARDNEGHTANMKVFKEHMISKGHTFVAEESILITDTDFAALATKVAAQNPDSVWLGVNAVQAANVVIQLRQAGVDKNIKFFGTAGLGDDYRKAGGEAVNNTYYSQDYFVEDPAPENQAYVKAFTAKYGVPPDNFGTLGYTEMWLTAHAIKSCIPKEVTRLCVADALRSMKDVPILLGDKKWSLGPDRVPTYKQRVFLIKDGKPDYAP